MKVGGLRRLVVPPSLAYGPVRYGPIPPDATLVFDIDLVDVQASPTQCFRSSLSDVDAPTDCDVAQAIVEQDLATSGRRALERAQAGLAVDGGPGFHPDFK